MLHKLLYHFHCMFWEITSLAERCQKPAEDLCVLRRSLFQTGFCFCHIFALRFKSRVIRSLMIWFDSASIMTWDMLLWLFKKDFVLYSKLKRDFGILLFGSVDVIISLFDFIINYIILFICSFIIIFSVCSRHDPSGFEIIKEQYPRLPAFAGAHVFIRMFITKICIASR